MTKKLTPQSHNKTVAVLVPHYRDELTPDEYLKRLSMFSNVRWYTRHPHDLEDIFWANIAPRVCPNFRIAPFDEGLKFSFESAPQYCFEQNNYQLPFGCHGWNRNERDFWVPYLLSNSQCSLSFG